VHAGQPIMPVLHANSAIGSQDYGGRFRIVGFSETQRLPTQLIKPAAFRYCVRFIHRLFDIERDLDCLVDVAGICRAWAAFATAAARSSRSRISLIKDLIATSAICSSMFKSSLPPKAVHYRFLPDGRLKFAGMESKIARRNFQRDRKRM
jgi:hypothetical protein